MTAEELMERWQISALDLMAILSEYELRFRDANDLSTYAYDGNMLNTKFLHRNDMGSPIVRRAKLGASCGVPETVKSAPKSLPSND